MFLKWIHECHTKTYLSSSATKNKIPESWPKKDSKRHEDPSNACIHHAQSASAVNVINGCVPNTKLERSQSEGTAKTNSDSALCDTTAKGDETYTECLWNIYFSCRIEFDIEDKMARGVLWRRFTYCNITMLNYELRLNNIQR